MKKTIVLAASYSYERQLLATIKSICWHNDDICFYILHKDIPKEWFDQYAQEIDKSGCQLIGKKIDNDLIDTFRVYPHISSSSTFFRYFIPELLEEDKVLYLDSDLVVLGNLDELFAYSLDGYGVAACKDLIGRLQGEKEFNAGVMLINNKLWKEENILQQALQLHKDKDSELKNADQSALNLLFADRYLSLPLHFNQQVGQSYIAKISRNAQPLPIIKNPLILHYTSENKPWKKRKIGYWGRYKIRKQLSLQELFSGILYTEEDHYWFFYDQLSFADIQKKKAIL